MNAGALRGRAAGGHADMAGAAWPGNAIGLRVWAQPCCAAAWLELSRGLGDADGRMEPHNLETLALGRHPRQLSRATGAVDPKP
jgi:hypothetical protein